MLIILDTNVIHEDFLLRSGRFQILLDYAERTESKVVLPKLVVDELASNYERELRLRYSKLAEAAQKLDLVLPAGFVSIPPLDFSRAREDYVARLIDRLEVTSADLVDHSESILRDALARAIERKPPCTERGEEIRDAILWGIILEVAERRKQPVVFVSRNHREFSADKQSLHPVLAAEARDQRLRIEFFPSLDDFARAHATPIAFITTDWLQGQIGGDNVLDAAYDAIVASAHKAAIRSRPPDVDSLADFRIDSGFLEVDEFFVYAMAAGEYRVHINWFGHADVEYEAETESGSIRWDDSDYGDVGSYSRRSALGGPRTTRTMSVELSVHAVTEVIVEEAKVQDWTLVDVWAEK